MRTERGAVLIFVAIALAGLFAFASIVVDYGALWTARGEAQTAADAGALAAAQSMAWDNTKDWDYFKAVGRAVGRSNRVFGQLPDIQLDDVTFPPCPPSDPAWGPDTCVKVEAFRNQARNNPLPVFFAPLLGIQEHGVRAYAVARAISGNATTCLKPWAVGDKWLDSQVGGWSQTATYNPVAGDSYIPPSATDPGNGFSAKDAAGNPTYYGYQMVLKLASPGQGQNEIPINSAGWAMELALNNAAAPNPSSTPAYNANIMDCTSDTVAISPGGTCTEADPSIGCLAVKTGSTGNNNAKSVADFIANHDPSATWTNGGAGDWRTGTVTSAQSPSSRIVPIAIFSVPEYTSAGYTGSNGLVRVINIVGFFVEGTCDTVAFKESYLQCPTGGNEKAAVVGRLINYPAQLVGSGGSVAGAFGKVIVLVR